MTYDYQSETMNIIKPSKWGKRICSILHFHLWQNKLTMASILNYFRGIPEIKLCIMCRRFCPDGERGASAPHNGIIFRFLLWIRDVLDAYF